MAHERTLCSGGELCFVLCFVEGPPFMNNRKSETEANLIFPVCVGLTGDVGALVDVADGVAVLEAEFLVQRVARPSLTER